jgi:hypothetical protein
MTLYSDRAGAFRFKALLCEQRASESADPKSKQDWAELAIDWHAMAHFITRTEDQSDDYEWTQGAMASTSVAPAAAS